MICARQNPHDQVMRDKLIRWLAYILCIGIVFLCILSYIDYKRIRLTEHFENPSLLAISNAALDAAPSTFEVKRYYRTLLLFADRDIRATGNTAFRILADIRNRIYEKDTFRANLKVEDILADLPPWIEPIDPTINEAMPAVPDVVSAESRILAYIQKNFPEESQIDPAVGSIVTNIIQDFGYRFVFDKNTEKVVVGPNFLSKPLLDGWVNPIQPGT